MEASDRVTLAYLQSHPLEAARLLETMAAADAAQVLAPLPTPICAAALEQCLPATAAAILHHVAPDTMAEVLEVLPSSAAMGILRQLPPEGQVKLLDQLDREDPKVGATLRRALSYPDGTAGSLADPRVLTLPPDITVGEALKRVRRDPQHATYYHYVLERNATLAGLITLKELLAAEDRQLLVSIMRTEIVSLPAEATGEELRQHPHWRLYHTLPVVDRAGIFLGALRHRTLRKVEEEAKLEPNAATLPHALLKLWELYALVGVRLMTDVASLLTTEAGLPSETPPQRPTQERRQKEREGDRP